MFGLAGTIPIDTGLSAPQGHPLHLGRLPLGQGKRFHSATNPKELRNAEEVPPTSAMFANRILCFYHFANSPQTVMALFFSWLYPTQSKQQTKQRKNKTPKHSPTMVPSHRMRNEVSPRCRTQASEAKTYFPAKAAGDSIAGIQELLGNAQTTPPLNTAAGWQHGAYRDNSCDHQL